MSRSHGGAQPRVGYRQLEGSVGTWLGLLIGVAVAVVSLVPAAPSASARDSSAISSSEVTSPTDDSVTGAATGAAKSWHVRYTYSTRWGRVNLLYGNKSYGYRHIKQRRGWSDNGMNEFIRRVFGRGQRICEDPPRCSYLKFSLVRNVTRTRATQDLVIVRNVLHSRAPRRIGIVTAYSRRIDFPRSGGRCVRICYP